MRQATTPRDMQLVANQQLVKNRARLGLGFLLASFACLSLAVFSTLQVDVTAPFNPVPYIVMILGLVLYTIGMNQLRRWGPRNRHEEALADAIRALDERYKMYAFLSSSVPDYILVSPAGVHVLVPRSDTGNVACIRDKWSTKSGPSFFRWFGSSPGDPTADANRQLEKLRKVLEEAGLQDVPSSSVIVFTDPKVHLRIEGCTSNIARTSKLEEVLRRMSGKGRNVALTTSRVREIQRVFDDRMQAAHSWR